MHMRLLNIVQCANLGGMEQSNLLRLKGLMARGHEVAVISLNPLGAMAPLFREARIPAVGLDYRGLFGWRSIGAMRREFGKHRPDAILMTGHNLAATLCLLGNPARSKLQTIHHTHLDENKSRLRWQLIYRLVDFVFDNVTFCSGYIFEEAMALSPHLRGKARVVADPFDMPTEKSTSERIAEKERFGFSAEGLLVGNAGRLVESKRFDIFLRVAAMVARQRPDVAFLIAGDGPLRADLEALAAELGIADRVRFLGWRPDLGQFYSALDLLLFSSDYDALGRVPVEAAAAGVPVLASLSKGGLREVLRPPEEIILFDRHNTEALGSAVLDLLRDSALRARLSTAGRARVADYSSVRLHAEAIEQLLGGNADGGRPDGHRGSSRQV